MFPRMNLDFRGRGSLEPPLGVGVPVPQGKAAHLRPLKISLRNLLIFFTVSRRTPPACLIADALTEGRGDGRLIAQLPSVGLASAGPTWCIPSATSLVSSETAPQLHVAVWVLRRWLWRLGMCSGLGCGLIEGLSFLTSYSALFWAPILGGVDASPPQDGAHPAGDRAPSELAI
jgi:hypothetical protein